MTNPLYETLTATEAAKLWDLEESTVRRALWEGRIIGRKSEGVNLVTVTQMQEAYGQMPEHNICDFICNNLTPEDTQAWHEGQTTQNVTDLMETVNADCIQIWGSHEGPEPPSVTVC